jgi:hypothetical protein
MVGGDREGAKAEAYPSQATIAAGGEDIVSNAGAGSYER